MKLIFAFIVSSMLSLSAYAYLVKGVRTSILLQGPAEKTVKEILFEGCEDKDCKIISTQAKCNSEKTLKWHCYLKDQYPNHIRFIVIFKNNKTIKSRSLPTNGESALSNHELIIQADSIEVKKIATIL